MVILGCGKKTQPWQTRVQQPKLDSAEFTAIVADAIREAVPTAKVQIDESLAIAVQSGDSESSFYLDNAWRECRDDPEIRVDVVMRQLEALEDGITAMQSNAPPNLEYIVPVIKDKRWLDQSGKQGLQVYREPLAADFFVTYAEDGPSQLRFVNSEEFEAFEMKADELRAKAVENLGSRLTTVERHGEGPLYMLVAGGTFEASLLLLPDVWSDQQPAVDGRIVVGVPSRDLVLFTGENASEAIQQMRTAVKNVHVDGNYLISQTLLVLDQGRWIPYDD